MLKELFDFPLPPQSLDDDDCAHDLFFIWLKGGVVALDVFHDFEFHSSQDLFFLHQLFVFPGVVITLGIDADL